VKEFGGLILKRIVWILFIVTLFVLGCSSVKDQEGGIKVPSESAWANSKSPSDLFIGQRDDEMELIQAPLETYCWKKTKEDHCSLTPDHPKETLEGWKPLLVTPGEHLTFFYDNITDNLPYPDEITFTQFRVTEEEGEEVDIFVTDYDHETQERQIIEAPAEPGKFYYLVHLQWNEELNGEAYYAYTTYVREET